MDNMERQPINRGICIHLHVKILQKIIIVIFVGQSRVPTPRGRFMSD